ncbi:allantoinase PuuE [Rhizosaccharibacter radicis]|uniref:Chitooligosaccharide deacetylase n=1 Tax=Rhizosaccharibacter radicis TaxID=2782605 RepID=A0ABT1VWX1_9PROT|nr:allantoinase PuuE [Acetobacteraceae bacterium KSS12]
MHDPASYPRDLRGYGPRPPDPRWPGGARIAVQFVLNYEEGAENCVLHGDAASEAFLSEITGAQPIPGARHINMESLYEYGSRVGVWRLLRLFADRRLPLTAFAVGMAIERHPEVAHALVEAGHEIATHGYRWIDYQHVSPEREREDMERAIDAQKAITGERPLGWYLGRCSPTTRALVAAEGGFLYDADSYADELPYWDPTHRALRGGRPQLVVPYTLDANDMRFAIQAGFTHGEDFFRYLRDSFDFLYREGERSPRMLSIGLHCRLAGRPGRAAALARFLDHVQSHAGVWICRRVDIARHWHQHHPFEPTDAR